MKPPSRRMSSDDEAFPELDALLRAEAEAARREPPAPLEARIMAAVRTARPRGPVESLRKGRDADERRPWIPRLAAAAIVAVFSLWIAFQLTEDDKQGVILSGQNVVQPLLALLQLETPRAVAQADTPLLAEARNLWNDTSRAARGFVNRLPGPLRPAAPETTTAELPAGPADGR